MGGAVSIRDKDIKNVRGKVENLSVVYEWFIKKNLTDGDTRYHIDSIDSFGTGQEFIVPEDAIIEKEYA